MQQKLHILFLCGWYPSRVIPNNGDFIQRHAECVSLRHKVSVLHIISDENCTQNTEFTSEKVNEIETHITYLKNTKSKIQKAIRFYKAFKKSIHNIDDFDVVHVNKLFPFGLLALYLKWFKKKEFIVSEHWTGYHYPNTKNISSLEIFLSKIIGKNAKYLCPVSKDLQKSMEKSGIIGNYKVVPNVVDTSIFKPIDSKPNTFTILHVSNMLDSHKNVSGIIKAIQKLSKVTNSFELILVGENAIQYKKLSEEFGISEYVHFIKHIPHYKIAKLMQEASVFLLFSNYENLPCVILESFSCGTPVISTNVGGISEYFPNDFGFLIDVNNESQLLEKLECFAMRKLNTDKEKLHSYVSDNFSEKVIADTFSNLYHN